MSLSASSASFAVKLFSSLAPFASSAVRLFVLVAVLAVLFAAPPHAYAQPGPIGIVIMHGKGGAPTGLVSQLATSLEGQGYLVANLEMPWSGKRNYDVPVARGEEEVAAAVAALRGKGAARVFVAGHSQGGVFALHLAGKLPVDGVICMAPGGNLDHQFFWSKLSDSFARARKLVAEGKGNEPATLDDFEGDRGTYQVVAAPAVYVTWFDPEGAMNMTRGARAANPSIPILWIVPRRERPGLQKTNLPMFRALPSNPMTKLYEPDSEHRTAPPASADEIARWTKEVAARRP